MAGPHGRCRASAATLIREPAAVVVAGRNAPNHDLTSAFELLQAKPVWWLEIMDGGELFGVEDSHIAIPDGPGLGVSFTPDEAKKYLREEDGDFFDE